MKISIILFFIFSFVLLISFVLGQFFVFGKNASIKTKANYSIYLAFLMVLYFISCITLVVVSLFNNTNEFLGYIVFLFFPFIIGSISNYKNLKFYTFLQISIVLIGCVSSFASLSGY